MAKDLTIVVAGIKKLAIVVAPVLAFLVFLRIDATVGWQWLSFLKWPAYGVGSLGLLFVIPLIVILAGLYLLAGVLLGVGALQILGRSAAEAWKKARKEPSKVAKRVLRLLILCALIYSFCALFFFFISLGI